MQMLIVLTPMGLTFVLARGDSVGMDSPVQVSNLHLLNKIQLQYFHAGPFLFFPLYYAVYFLPSWFTEQNTLKFLALAG